MDPRLPYLEAFARQRPLLAAEPDTLRQARRRALERFGALGFPTDTDEAWRFTRLGALRAATFVPPPELLVDEAIAAAVRAAAGDGAGPRLVFVDGHFAPGLSAPVARPDGLVAAPLASAPMRPELLAPGMLRDADGDRPFAALNAALTRDGALLHVPRGLALAEPVSLVFVATGDHVAHPRTVIALGAESRATLVEHHLALGPGAAFTNAAVEVAVGAGAALEHHRLSGGGAFHVGSVDYRVGQGGRLTAVAVARGGRLQRHDVTVALGPGAAVTLGGLALAAGAEQVDHHALVDHAAPGARSRALYKGVLDGHAHAVFDGAVLVRPAAQQTDAVVQSHTLLLSADATVNSKPQFNIHADDVKCTHAATVGQLRAEELFYLRSRGLDLESARALLLEAFAAEVLEVIGQERVRAALRRALVEWLPRPARLREAA